jgi:hypothetical protein
MTVTIARPVEDVFGVLSDVKNVPIWSSTTIDETLLTPGPLRKGSRRRAVIKGFAGRTMQNEAPARGSTGPASSHPAASWHRPHRCSLACTEWHSRRI